MGEVEIIKKNIDGDFTGNAWLVKSSEQVEIMVNDDEKITTQYFIVSGTIVMFTGWEVLVFPSDKEGNILDWGQIAGGRGISHEEAIKELEEYLNG